MIKHSKRLAILLLSISFLLSGMPANQTYAATKTVNLRPATTYSGQLISNISLDGSPAIVIFDSTLVQNKDNVLSDDGQFAEFVPGEGGSSVLFVKMEDMDVCESAKVEDASINIKWYEEQEGSTGDDSAMLVLADLSGGTPLYEADVTIITTPSPQITVEPKTKLFGGLNGTAPGSNVQGTFSGNAPTQPTLQTAPMLHNIPTVSELNSPEAVVGIVLGDLPEGSSEPVSGFVDYLSIDVTYDDSSCFPALDPSTIAPPKTGAALTIFIISAGALSALGSSLVTLRKRRKNRIQSERQ